MKIWFNFILIIYSKSANESTITATAPLPSIFADLVIDLPTILDVPSEKVIYTSPKRVDTWTTDPLPHVQIGSHKRGDTTTATATSSSNIEDKVCSPSVPKTIPTTTNGSPVTSSIKQASADYIKLLTTEEKKLVKSKQKEMIVCLKEKSGYTLSKLEQAMINNASKSKKELQQEEKLAEKLFKRSLKLVVKKGRSKEPLTYSELSKKLEKEVKCGSSDKSSVAHIERVIAQMRDSLESGSLLAHFSPKPASGKIDDGSAAANSISLDLSKQNGDVTRGEPNEQVGAVLRRVPSLTWREANERARILFYKGRIPSIHYNEKRDSFRVSMLTHIATQDGQDLTTEVPVNDEDVRRLLNSYGLYWDGESISLLNKSDEIFTSAQREAYEYLSLLNQQRQQQQRQQEQQLQLEEAEESVSEQSATEKKTEEEAEISSSVKLLV